MDKSKIKKIVLAYSGGLDTSVIIPWLKEHYNDPEIIAVAAGLHAALTVHSVRRDIFALIAEVHQRGHIIVRDEDDISASAAVSAIRASRGNILLSVERNNAVAALAGDNGYCGLINKHGHGITSLSRKTGREISRPVK